MLNKVKARFLIGVGGFNRSQFYGHDWLHDWLAIRFKTNREPNTSRS